MSHPQPPSLVIFEGVDGVGKTTLARALAYYLRVTYGDSLVVHEDTFPGAIPGSLGDWIYRLHHKCLPGSPTPEEIAPPALQLLHIAAHVDAIVTRLAPVLRANGSVVLDRYWWSTYAYARFALPPQRAWDLVHVEHGFWHDLPPPVIVYLTRNTSLKPSEIHPATHEALERFYAEVREREHERNARILHLSNDGDIRTTWTILLASLNLRPAEFPGTAL